MLAKHITLNSYSKYVINVSKMSSVKYHYRAGCYSGYLQYVYGKTLYFEPLHGQRSYTGSKGQVSIYNIRQC